MATLSSKLIVDLVDQVSAPARRVANSLRGITKVVKDSKAASFGDRLGAEMGRTNRALANARAGMFSAAAGLYALKAALTAPISSAQKMETALAELGTKANLPAKELAKIRDAARTTGTAVNQFAQDVVKAQDFLVGMGLSVGQSTAAMGAIGKAATATKADIIDLSKAGFAAISNLKIAPEELAKSFDVMAAAGKAGGFELKDMATYLPAITGLASTKGITGTKGLADIVAALQLVRKTAGDGAQAAVNFENILQKINSNQTVSNFSKFGIDINKVMSDAVASGGSPLEASLRAINEAIGGDLSKLGLLFSDAQVQKGLIPLLVNLDTYVALRKKVGAASGVVDRDFSRMMQTNAEKTKKLAIQMSDLSQSVGEGLLKPLSRISEALAVMVKRVTSLVKQFPRATAAIVGATASLIAFKVAVVGLKFVGLLGKSGALSMLALGFNTVGKAAIGAKRAVSGMVGLQSTLAAMEGRPLGVLGKLRAGFKGIALAVPGMAVLGDALVVVGGAIAAISAPAWGLIVAGITAVAAAGATIWKYWGRIEAIFGGVAKRIGEELAPALDKIRPVLDWLAPIGEKIAGGWRAAKEAMSGFWNWLTGSFSKEVLTEDQKKNFEQSGYDIADRLIKGVKELPARIREVSKAFFLAGKELITSLWDGMKQVFADLLTWFDSKMNSLLGLVSKLGDKIRALNPFAAPSAPPPSSGFIGPMPKRARGGPISRGGAYLVGEEGPELITASRSGYVHPNGAGRGGPASVQIGPFTFHNTTAADAEVVAQQVRRSIHDEIGDAFRGIYADAGLRIV